MIEDAFENATDSEIKEIEELTDTAIENMFYELGYFEEKYYKTGFADGVRLIIECVGGKNEVLQWTTLDNELTTLVRGKITDKDEMFSVI